MRHAQYMKKAVVDLWQLAFSYQVNPLAAAQPLPSSTPGGSLCRWVMYVVQTETTYTISSQSQTKLVPPSHLIITKFVLNFER